MKTEKGNTLEKRLVIKSKTENLSEVRDFVSSFAESAGFGSEMIENMILAVDEACTNVIKHAYKSVPDGEIEINLKYSGGRLTIEITDYGKSFEPEKISTPDLQKYFAQRRVGGLGMYLMKTLMDDVKYVSIPGKCNRVLLSKNISAGS